MRICFRDENWCQEDGSADITKTFDTSGLSAGTYTIIAEVSAKGQGWDTATKTYGSYQLTAPQQSNPQPTSAPPSQPSISCNVDSFDAWPRTATVGDTIHISGSGSCNVGVRATKVRIDGGDLYEIGNPSLDWNWNTAGYSAGEHTLRLWVSGQGDNNWGLVAKSGSITIQLNSPNKQSQPSSSTTFTNSDIIQIGGDIFVISVDSSGNQERHLIPNPETLDALGIPRSWVNNKGLSEGDLKAIHRGSDIPDVNRDYNSFLAFKNKYFPNTAPISGGDSESSSSSQDTSCPSQPATLSAGDIAVIADYGARLNLREQPSINADIITQMKPYTYVTIISGPKCGNGYRWYEVGFNGKSGWAAEVGPDNDYNLIKNGQAVPTAPSKPNPTSTSVPKPVPTATEEPEKTTVQPETQKDLCPDEAYINFRIVSFLLGAFLNVGQGKIQCVQYVREHWPDSKYIPKDSRQSAWMWVKKAQENGFDVDTSGNLMNGRTGDVVVWGQYCEDAGKDGHIAILLYWEYDKNGNIDLHVNESNWGNSDGKDNVHTYMPRVSCISFIHPKSSPNEVNFDGIVPPNEVRSSQPDKPSQPVDKCSQLPFLKWIWCKLFGD